MLKNPELFKNVETGLRSMGTIKAFEDEHGKIIGRAMINLTDIPESVEVKRPDRENLTAFEITFDFYNVALGIVVDTKKRPWKAACGVGIRHPMPRDRLMNGLNSLSELCLKT